jgi:hypothetical protein
MMTSASPIKWVPKNTADHRKLRPSCVNHIGERFDFNGLLDYLSSHVQRASCAQSRQPFHYYREAVTYWRSCAVAFERTDRRCDRLLTRARPSACPVV